MCNININKLDLFGQSKSAQNRMFDLNDRSNLFMFILFRSKDIYTFYVLPPCRVLSLFFIQKLREYKLKLDLHVKIYNIDTCQPTRQFDNCSVSLYGSQHLHQ